MSGYGLRYVTSRDLHDVKSFVLRLAREGFSATMGWASMPIDASISASSLRSSTQPFMDGAIDVMRDYQSTEPALIVQQPGYVLGHTRGMPAENCSKLGRLLGDGLPLVCLHSQDRGGS